jgi:nitrous oxidase accessory protein NosD
MKTKTVIIFLTFYLMIFFCSTIFGQKNDLRKLNLNGNIKSIREFSYKAIEKLGDIQKGKAGFFYYNFFSNKGNKIEDNRYNPDGSLVKKYIYKYNSKGNRIEENQFTSEDILIRKITYKYDKKKNIIEDNSYTPEGKQDKKYTYKYDNKGNIINK